AMLVRNAVILGLLAPLALLDSAVPLALMIVGAAIAVLLHRQQTKDRGTTDARKSANPSPYFPHLNLRSLLLPHSSSGLFSWLYKSRAHSRSGRLASSASTP